LPGLGGRIFCWIGHCCGIDLKRAGSAEAPPMNASDHEQEQQGDQQRENAERFRHREAKDQAAELAFHG
jgi:hypothetical protein